MKYALPKNYQRIKRFKMYKGKETWIIAIYNKDPWNLKLFMFASEELYPIRVVSL